MASNPIVAGTDGSASAERAVDRAGELAQALDAPLHVVTCYASASAEVLLAAAGGFAVGELDTGGQVRAEEIVAHSRDRLEARGVTVHTHVCTGDPTQALVTIADGENAQMIVVGNRGMAGARRVLGSVPNSVSHHAHCSVLIVPTS